MKRGMSVLTALVAMLFASATAEGQVTGGGGTITGQVTDRISGEPLTGARVTVTGVLRPSLTNDEGRYTIINVPAGQREVSATFIGYSPSSQTITIGAGGSATADFALARSAVELSAIITTATGVQQTARQIGNAVSNIKPQEIELAPVRNFSDLIQGRAVGVSVIQSSGTSGSGARIRIRGSNSVSLSNSPLLIVDGIRVDDNPDAYALFTGGQTTSRLNDFNPESIESIEVLKGPAAAALYGTAAANGVIQITTRRGSVGNARWSFWSEFSDFERVQKMPTNVLEVDIQPGGALRRCDFLRRAQENCSVDSVLTNNPLENPGTTPFRDGGSQRLGASVSGGSGTSTYFLSAEHYDETGVMEENDARRVNLRANLAGMYRDNVELSATAGYVDFEAQLPQNDNSAIGVLLNGLQAEPSSFFIDNWQGYSLPREYLFAWDQFQDLTRTTLSSQATWRPLTWLAVNGVAGLDNVNRHDNDLIPPDVLELFGPPFSIGLRESVRFNIINYTANLGATATWSPNNDLALTSSIGTQYYQDRATYVFAQGTGITAGTGSLHGATSDFLVDEETEETITLGTYFQQQLAWRDRVFLNAAVRGDRNSAFGVNLEWIWYPSFSASWVIAEEEFFPRSAAISDLRLRAAWGRSGLRPQFRDAQRFYSAVTAVANNQEVPGFVIAGVGNPDLRPELSSELEVGFDAGFLDDRLGLELTFYDKRSKDALVQVPLPPSGGGAAARLENIGRVSNRGWEFGVNATPVETPNVSLFLAFSGFTNDNELESLGGEDEIVFGLNGDTQRHQEGYPLGGYWQRTYTYADDDADWIIDTSEVVVGEPAFLGSAFPEREFSFRTELTLWRNFRLSGLLDHKGGYKLFNATKWIRCVDGGVYCAERYADPGNPADQAAMIAATATPNSSLAGFFEDAAFWRLRELSLTYQVPQRFAGRIGAQGLSLTLASRNVATWTDYTGFDPEINSAAQANFSTFDATAIPPNRTWVLRADISF